MPMTITTKELARRTAGGTDFIRTKNGQVKGLALRRDLNPEAPEVVWVGKGKQRQSRAALFVQSQVSAPVYVKRGIDAWEYIGQYRAIAYHEGQPALRRIRNIRTRSRLAGALYLEPTDRPTVSIAGGGFPDLETRKKTEEAAIVFVVQLLESRGYSVEDRQPENQGYDLLAVKATDTIHAEVKGTRAVAPHFFLSRNEWCFGQQHSTWRVFVVCNVGTCPNHYEYSAAQLQEQFQMEPLAWEVQQRDA